MQILPLFTGGIAKFGDHAACNNKAANADDRRRYYDRGIFAALVRTNAGRGPRDSKRIHKVPQLEPYEYRGGCGQYEAKNADYGPNGVRPSDSDRYKIYEQIYERGQRHPSCIEPERALSKKRFRERRRLVEAKVDPEKTEQQKGDHDRTKTDMKVMPQQDPRTVKYAADDIRHPDPVEPCRFGRQELVDAEPYEPGINKAPYGKCPSGGRYDGRIAVRYDVRSDAVDVAHRREKIDPNRRQGRKHHSNGREAEV